MESKLLRNYLIIGAQRCGTTSLYRYLCAHPNVLRHRGATCEIHFFDWQYVRGYSWYRAQFPKVRGTGCITGEGSPSYIFDPAVPMRVKKHKPDAKLLVLLRNPADRAYSHYNHSKSRGVETSTFRKALDIELVRQGRAEYREWLNWAYLARGRYVEQLARWFELFPREQFHIIKSEDFFADSDNTMQAVFEFLGLESFSVFHAYKVHNKQRYCVDESTYDWLRDYFKPYNEQLYELLEWDFGWDD